MASTELTNERDLTYSTWHRVQSIARYTNTIFEAKSLVMMDFDFVEYDYFTKEPVLYIELTKDIGQSYNAILSKIYRDCGSYIVQAKKIFFANTHGPNITYEYAPPVYLVCYKQANTPNPSNKRWPDIESFRIMELWPNKSKELIKFTPVQWVMKLVKQRNIWRQEWSNRTYLPKEECHDMLELS